MPDTHTHAKGNSSQTSCISFQSFGFYTSLKYLERAITPTLYSCNSLHPGNSVQPTQRLANAAGSLQSGQNTNQSCQRKVPESCLPLDCPFLTYARVKSFCQLLAPTVCRKPASKSRCEKPVGVPTEEQCHRPLGIK